MTADLDREIAEIENKWRRVRCGELLMTTAARQRWLHDDLDALLRLVAALRVQRDLWIHDAFSNAKATEVIAKHDAALLSALRAQPEQAK